MPLDMVKAGYANSGPGVMDNATANRIKKQLAQEFRDQLVVGAPTDADEKALSTLLHQIRDKKVIVKLFLQYQLHAKLYLAFRNDRMTPIIGYLGSSNLTLAGLNHQGELNIDVLEQDAARKQSGWFDERWEDRWCIDITNELIEILDSSWATEKLIPPYYIYLKIDNPVFIPVSRKQVLHYLLKGTQPVILALARGMMKKWPSEIKAALDADRMLIITAMPTASPTHLSKPATNAIA